MVGDLERAAGADLELPLAEHDLGVDAVDLEPRRQAGAQVLLDEPASVDLVRPHAAVELSLGRRVAGIGPAERSAAAEQGVLLLDAEPRLRGLAELDDRAQQGAGVGAVRRTVGVVHLAQHEQVAAAADRIRAGERRLQDAVALVAGRLVGAGAVEAPLRGLLPAVQHLGLGTQLAGRLGAVHPDVLGQLLVSVLLAHFTLRGCRCGHYLTEFFSFVNEIRLLIG